MRGRQSKKTQASEAQHYIRWQRIDRTSDGEGGFDNEKWTDVQTVPAAILPLRADQRFEYKTKNVDATHIIKVRGKLKIIENTDRFLWGTRVFEILTVEDLQEREFIKWCLCLEKR